MLSATCGVHDVAFEDASRIEILSFESLTFSPARIDCACNTCNLTRSTTFSPDEVY